MDQVVDLSAKLLANEDITVVRANRSTASFDIKTRVLTIPMWKEMTPEIEGMLVGHEVGHALYTTDEYGATIDENTKIKTYLNVIEDVRIERLIKRKYPGLRKTMSAGYKQLNERDFFGVENLDTSKLLLIDKINLYYKAGLNFNFNPAEKQFVVRAERTESIQDVIDLANEIFAYSLAEREAQKKEEQETAETYASIDAEPEYQEFDEDDMDSDDFEDWNDDFEESEESNVPAPADTFDDEDPEDEGEDSNTANPTPERSTDAADDIKSRTAEQFDKNLEDLADTETEYKYWNFVEYDRDPVINYKFILSDLSEKIVQYRDGYDNHNEKLRDEFAKFKTETMRNVNYLVKEFEMRKSAKEYKRSMTAKTGQLDMKKIFGYQINEDLFKRVTVVQKGKNHGMMILLDWSGSMDNVIQDTIKQVINLALFCQRVQIPYEVYAFTNGYYNRDDREAYELDRITRSQTYAAARDSEKDYIDVQEFNLLNFFSSKMTSSDFFKMAELLLDWRSRYVRAYALSSTPLNEALFWVYKNLGDYIAKNNIEKMSFITLTDGEGHALPAIKGGMRDKEIVSYGEWDEATETRTPDVWKKYKHFVRDDVTKKTYTISYDGNDQTRTLLKMIKDRHGVNSVGFYITRNNRRDLYWAIRSNTTLSGYEVDREINVMRQDFRSEGFYSVKGSGRDELFIISQNKMKINDGELDASGEMTPRKLASNFGKFLNQKQTSRVLLNRFIGWVA